MAQDSKRNSEIVEPSAQVGPDNSVRARNRTVMLTAEVTGDLRSRFSGDGATVRDNSVSQSMVERFERANEWESVLGSNGGGAEAIRLGGEISPESLPDVEPIEGAPESAVQMALQVADDAFAMGEQFSQGLEVDEGEYSANDAGSQTRIIRRATSIGEYVSREGAADEYVAPEMEIFTPERFHPDDFGVPEAAPEPVRPDAVYWKQEGELVGFLVSYDYNGLGSYVELRTGRLLVSREVDHLSDCLVINHESVGVLHAILRIESPHSIKLLDQLSEQGTRVIRRGEAGGSSEEIALSGDKVDLRNGDILCFGERRFYLCLVPKELE